MPFRLVQRLKNHVMLQGGGHEKHAMAGGARGGLRPEQEHQRLAGAPINRPRTCHFPLFALLSIAVCI